MKAASLGLGMALLLPSFVDAQTAPPAPVTVNGDATLVSDYRYRGLSRSDVRPAAQANAGLQTIAGFYAGVWASSIASYGARGSDVEVDLFGGYRKTIGGTTIDGGLLYYVYPGHDGGATDYAEPYLSVAHTLGPLSAKLGGNVAWKQRGLGLGGDRRSGIYTYAEVAVGVPRTGLTVTAHGGHSFTPNAATLGLRYTDWSLAGTYTLRRLTLGLAYVDTDRRLPSYPGAGSGAGNSRDIAGAGPLASIGIAF